jgi:nicotinamide mononucleotide transporter
LYTAFYLNQSEYSFAFGFTGSALFVWLCWKSRIYADAALQIIYALLAIWGWYHVEPLWTPQHLTSATHGYFIASICLGTWLLGNLLKQYTKAANPFLDCFITCTALSGTWLQVNFFHDNWIYFIVVNVLSILLYARRRLFVACLMYVVYLVMSLDGYLEIGLFGA